MNSSRMRTLAVAGACLVIALGSVAQAEDDGRILLERAVAHYADLDAYAAEMVINLELPEEFAAMGGHMEPSRYTAIATDDGRVAFRPLGGMINDPFVQNTEQWYAEISFMKAYILQEAVPLSQLLDEESNSGVPIPGCADFLRFGRSAGEAGSLLAAASIHDAGGEDVGGVACRHLELRDGVEGEVWVTEGATPWIARIKMAPPKPSGDEGGGMMIIPTMDLTFTSWNGDPELDDAFTIEINKEYTRRDSMPGPDDFHGGGGMSDDDDFLNKPAPALSLPTLDGGTMNLDDLKGQVVVLDFWAVWCKPCLMALPGVMEVTSELADRGVAFYAVNQRDPVAKIKTLLAEKGWTLPVALDSDGSAGTTFGVQGIPHTVIIDRNGTIRHVHSGYFPGMDKQLRAELEALLLE